ncbi:MAG: hypothetical protein CMI55_04100 [Parcubacteria group bacterium]|jgi:general secretion pathway protein G|nr:hypothetical protein [Parcubacteria group bacterium]|tara:strand:+ start:5166 stop:5600 length:435 start_codon:yes stop_codon:yes gene_type:complete
MIKIKNNSGFTLLELLIVVFIIGLLAVLVLVNISNVRSKSRDSSRVADIQAIQNGLAMYETNNQAYPDSLGVQTEITGSDLMSSALIGDGVMKGVPVDPTNAAVEGVTYKYYYTSDDGSDYLLEYYLETNSVLGKSQGLNTASP